MWEVVKFVALSTLLLFFAAALGVPGVAALRAGETGTAVGMLLFSGFFGLAVVANVIELVEKLRRPVLEAPPRSRAPALGRGQMLSNLGPTPDAFFVTTHGSATGYHFTEKLTPDGVLAGYQHDEFTPGFTQTYGVRAPAAVVERVFACARSPEFAALPNNISDPRIHDGHVLRLTARLGGVERVIWLANTEHPLLTPLVAELRALRPTGGAPAYVG